jgi:hypothetical protein
MAQILIIEDDQRLRLALKENLQLHGYDVTETCSCTVTMLPMRPMVWRAPTSSDQTGRISL